MTVRTSRRRVPTRLDPGTIGATLDGAALLLRRASSAPQRDAELLLSFTLKQPREYLLAHRRDLLPPPRARSFEELIRRRGEGIPLPYLTRTQEFFGQSFTVTPAVMIPRPETEALVEEALRLVSDTTAADMSIADIGTGSGAIAVSIALNHPRTHVVAADISPAALDVAQRNARRHGVLRRMTFLESDLLQELPPDRPLTVLVANLPYVSSAELANAGDAPDTRGLLFEPPRALDGGPDGLFILRRLLRQLTHSPAQRHLTHLCLEHHPSQRRRLLERAHAALPTFSPNEVTPWVTSWTRHQKDRAH